MVSPLLPVFNRAALRFVRGQGTHLFTETGETYLDFGAGVAVTSCGHAHPHLVAALTAQAQNLWHSSNLYQAPGQEKLAARLIDASFAETVFFCNSGAEALECAIKMARKYHAAKGHPEKYRLISFEGAFHGRTLATLAAGGQAKYLEGFGPRVEGFDQVPFGDLAAVKAAIGPHTAGILVEPLQGEGGVRLLPEGFLESLRHLCDAAGILLVLDEVQTGVGRTGKFFAHEWTSVTPDIMAIAKGIGNGFPLGACLATASAAAGMTAGTHGSTFGGNPLAMAAGNAVLDIIMAEGFLAQVQQRALSLKEKLTDLQLRFPDVIADVRGLGLMLGLKCQGPSGELFAAASAEKLLLVPAGDNVLRVIPPLTLSEQDINEAAQKLEAACRSVQAQHRKTL